MLKKDGYIKNDFGSCKWSFEGDYLHIHSLFVNKKYRRMGHARFLLLRTIEDIKDSGWNLDIYIVADPTDNSVDKVKLSNFYNNLGLPTGLRPKEGMMKCEKCNYPLDDYDDECYRCKHINVNMTLCAMFLAIIAA
jgi:GNAT superfamily N-acetyltransferase